MKFVVYLLSILSLSFLISCGGGEKKTEESAEQKETETVQADVVTVELTGNDLMQFNLKTIEVAVGSTVRINLKHIGQMAKETMGHNFILLKADVALAAFATSAMSAKDSEFIPPDKVDQIIAYTKLIGGGEETSIEFTAPAAGTYKFLCSFPGHYVMMQGDFIVK